MSPPISNFAEHTTRGRTEAVQHVRHWDSPNPSAGLQDLALAPVLRGSTCQVKI